MEKFQIEAGHEDDHVFVRGKTKFLKNLNDSEAAVLVKNGDRRITPVEAAPAEAANEIVTAETPAEAKPKKSKPQTEAPTHE